MDFSQILTGIGVGLDAYGRYSAGQNQAAAAQGQAMTARANAAAAQFNAQVALENAQITDQQKQVALEAQDRKAARAIGSMVASYGASGVRVDDGTPLDVLADSVATATLDRLTLAYNYDLKIRDYQNQAKLNQMNAANGLLAADAYASSADNYSTSGTLNAVAAGASGLATLMKMVG